MNPFKKVVLDAIVERDSLLRRMATLKEQNKKLSEKSSPLHSDVFGDLNSLKSKVKEQEKILSQRQELVITQVQAYKPIQENHVEPIVKVTNKGKGKATGI